MSEENVELVRDSLNAWVEIDEGLAEPSRAAEFWAPDVVLHFEDSPVALHGVDEFLKWRADMSAPYDDWSYSPEKILDAGGKRVVGTFHAHGKLRGTDDWVDWRYGIVWTVEEGLITEATMYTTQEKALEAAGLSE
jgi:ketosteroid isomerase-like protein